MKATLCDKAEDKKHMWLSVARPVKEGIIYYHVCKFCKKPAPYNFKHNGEWFGKEDKFEL
jgi:hypothetical protein